MSGRFCDAILIARDCHVRLGPASSANQGRKEPVLLMALVSLFSRDLTTHYGMAAPYSINILKTPKLDKLFGMYLRYVDHANIFTSLVLNTCWSRFTGCKELMHLACDRNQKHFASDPASQAEIALTRGLPRSETEELDSEDFAFYTAVEFLYPWATRYKTTASLGALSHQEIAKRFMIPEMVVKIYFTTGYGELSEQCNTGMSIP